MKLPGRLAALAAPAPSVYARDSIQLARACQRAQDAGPQLKPIALGGTATTDTRLSMLIARWFIGVSYAAGVATAVWIATAGDSRENGIGFGLVIGLVLTLVIPALALLSGFGTAVALLALRADPNARNSTNLSVTAAGLLAFLALAWMFVRMRTS